LGLPYNAAVAKTRHMKLSSWFAICVGAASLATVICTVRAEEPTASPAPSIGDAEDTPASDTEDATTQEVEFASPDEKFAFVIDRGEDERSIDLVDKKTKTGG
jgi:hypothetical protein